MSDRRLVDYIDWYPGEPSGKDWDDNEEHCMDLMDKGVETYFKWNDGTCSQKFRFICEKDFS